MCTSTYIFIDAYEIMIWTANMTRGVVALVFPADHVRKGQFWRLAETHHTSYGYVSRMGCSCPYLFFFCQEPPPKLNGSLGVSEDGAKTTLCAEF